MGMPRTIPEKTRALVLKMYQAGATNRDITSRTGVQPSTIYWILGQEKVKPDRLNKPKSSEREAQAVQALERIIERQEARIADLERQNGQLIAELARRK